VPEADVTKAVARHDAALERARAAARPLIEAPSALGAERDVDARTPSARGPRDLARATGSVVHRLLEIAATEPAESARRQLAALCREAATEGGLGLAALEREVREVIEGFLASPLAPRLREAKAIARELPIVLRRDDGGVFRGSIDLLYESGAGDLVVADFKTDREDDETRLRERYREQLAVYADAVRAAHGLPARPKAELWLLRAGHVIDVPLGWS
jgi:ATP-dependent exoDNAse (exonuclease V) beta subunit